MNPLILAPLAGAALILNHYKAALAKKASATFGAEKQATVEVRRAVIAHAVDRESDPVRLETLSRAALREGLKNEAALLQARARAVRAPASVKKVRRQVAQKAFQSRNPAAVEAVADAMYSEGLTQMSGALREYAAGLRALEARHA